MANFSFRKYRPLSLRVWHWLTAVSILGLLGTVLIRKTLLSWRTNAALIEEKLKAAGITITPELAREIAVAIRNPLWDWHIYLGFALGALFIGRVFIAFLVERQFMGAEVFKAISGLPRVPESEKGDAYYFILVKALYAVFYLFTAFMVVTGFMLTFKTDFGLSRELAQKTKELHELAMWFFVGFVGVHILGVIAAEVGRFPGIVSDMISGGDRNQE